VDYPKEKTKTRANIGQLDWVLGDDRFLIAASLAITAWTMNTDFVYNNASLVWPFYLGLGALDGHHRSE
jgi:hypothetical protein